MNPDTQKHNGNRVKVGKYHPGWEVMRRIQVVPGGRSAQELARLTGLTQQAISEVEHQALRKLKFRLQHSRADLGMFKHRAVQTL